MPTSKIFIVAFIIPRFSPFVNAKMELIIYNRFFLLVNAFPTKLFFYLYYCAYARARY